MSRWPVGPEWACATFSAPAKAYHGAVTVNGTPWYAFAGPETIDLSGLGGHVDLLAVRR